jgi:hypothetical protein
MSPQRRRVEEEIERLIALLDCIDGDPDLEPEIIENQGDDEADLTWATGCAPSWYLIAETQRRKAR